ncbi:TIGR03619 family F420-dependent LLM class oxidoreductase [Mycobacterium sp.]|uniref:TIGR03619 family F420-dependent LLM class oxidoreductase n=1 Tax=Mycobacterium sp. TaxID=1785 RepID=UPI003BB01CD2
MNRVTPFRSVDAQSRRATFGVALPFFDHQMDYDDVVRFATTVEAAGFDGFWLVDHLVAGPTPQFGSVWYDALTLLAGLAPIVPRITLGTDVLIVPYRHPVLAAKALATLDVLSQGRLIVGVGCGYLESEFAALGANYRDRGAVTNEYLRVWQAVWSEEPVTFAGEHITVATQELRPPTIQRPHPPIWVGGSSISALRRAAYFGDGWHPLHLSPEEYGHCVARLQDLRDQLGKPMPVLSYSGPMGAVTAKPIDRSDRRRLTGSVEQILEDVGLLKDQGVVNFVFRPGGADFSPDELREQTQRLGGEVIPHVR